MYYVASTLLYADSFQVKEKDEHPDLSDDVLAINCDKPPESRMFEPTPESRAKTAKSSDAAVPNITINIPPNVFPQVQAAPAPVPAPPSPGANAADLEWPSLMEFLQECDTRDPHFRDFGQHFDCLQKQEIFGPDDIVNCDAAELRGIGLSLGASKFLISEATRVKKEVFRQKRQRLE